MSQNRLLAMLLSVLAVLVLVVGGLSAFLLLTDDGDDGTAGTGGITTDAGTGAGAPAAGGRLRLASGDPVTLDPHLAGDATSAEYIVEIFSGLVTLVPDPDPESGEVGVEIGFDLADDLEVSDDGLVYTFTLRDDVRFHSGREVTAEDVSWSLHRSASRELASPQAVAFLGDIVGLREFRNGERETIEGIEVIDERTIRFTIDEPKPYFLAKLTYPATFVVDRQQVESNPRNWTRRPNGTGPYQLSEWRLGERIVLEAVEDHHLGTPRLRQAVYLLAGGSALTRFENDELDVSNVSINDIERARDSSGDLHDMYSVWGQFSVSYIALNTNQPPFDDVYVRRAMAMAMDRDRVARVTFDEMFTAATGLLMPQMPGYTSEDKTLPFDPEAAQEELAQSQYADDIPRIVVTEAGAGAEASIDTQAYLEQWRTTLGLDIEVRQMDWASFLREMDERRLQAFGVGWIMDYPDPENILDLKFHSDSPLNNTGFSDPEIDALLEEARVEQDPERRMEIYREVERTLIQDAVWIPLYFSQAHVVVRPEVQGWFEPPMVLPRLRYVEVDR